MIARLFLFIAIVFGLAAGPSAWGRGVRSCECCVMPADVTCCEAPSAPVQRTPVSSSNANEGQLKLAIQPFVTLLLPRLCVKPPVLEIIPELAPHSHLDPGDTLTKNAR